MASTYSDYKNQNKAKDKSRFAIIVEDLKTVLNGNVVHDSLNLELLHGQTMVVLGASGSGKSVLLKSIVRLIKPTSGSITIGGVDVLALTERGAAAIREDIGVLFQGSALFDSFNVRSNITFPLIRKKLTPKETNYIVEEKLALVGLDKSIADYMISELSMGIQKRVAIARAIVMNPKIMLYDEPTTGLDPLVVGIINELILDLQKELKLASLVVTHDLQSGFNVANRFAFLHDGYIAVCGDATYIKNTTNKHLRAFINASSLGQ